jgi:hypothetical protein
VSSTAASRSVIGSTVICTRCLAHGTIQLNAARNVARIRCAVAAGDGAHVDATPCEIYSKAFVSGLESAPPTAHFPDGVRQRLMRSAELVRGTGCFPAKSALTGTEARHLEPEQDRSVPQAELTLNNTWRHNLPRSLQPNQRTEIQKVQALRSERSVKSFQSPEKISFLCGLKGTNSANSISS